MAPSCRPPIPPGRWHQSLAPACSLSRLPRSARLSRGLGRWPGLAERHGFALPLALVVALLLLLSSLAMQTMILQVRSRRAVVLELRQAEDRLASAAHQLVGRLQERHPCLFGLNLAAWTVAGLTCGDPAEILGLIHADAHDFAWTVIDWRPLPGGRQVDLLLQVPDQSGRAPRRGQFRLELEPTASLPRVLALRPQGLRGIPAAEL
jgi:hypothetical protein